MHCTIRRPDRKLFEGEALRLTARSPHGEFAVMDGHAPLVSVLSPGVLRVERENESDQTVFVTGPGTLQVDPSGVQVLVETCDSVDEVDAAEIQQRLAESKIEESTADTSTIEHLRRLLEAKERYG